MYLSNEHSSAAPFVCQTEASGSSDYMTLNALGGMSLNTLYRVGGVNHSAVSANDLLSRNIWTQGISIHSSSSKRTCHLSGELVATNTDDVSISGLSRTGIGGLGFDDVNIGSIDTNVRIAEIALWKSELATWELESLARGVRPSFIRPDTLKFYVPLVNNVVDEKGFLT